jgi:hypothetical protein
MSDSPTGADPLDSLLGEFAQRQQGSPSSRATVERRLQLIRSVLKACAPG